MLTLTDKRKLAFFSIKNRRSRFSRKQRCKNNKYKNSRQAFVVHNGTVFMNKLSTAGWQISHLVGGLDWGLCGKVGSKPRKRNLKITEPPWDIEHLPYHF